MVILMDVSGSMKGTRKDVARQVVYNILETLGPNDFVNIYKFAEHVDSVVPCFNETLVQVCCYLPKIPILSLNILILFLAYTGNVSQ